MFWRVSAASFGVAASLALTTTGATAATGDDHGDFKVKNCVPDNKVPAPQLPTPKPPENVQPPAHLPPVNVQPPEKGRPPHGDHKNPCKMVLSGSKFGHGKHVLWMIRPWTPKGDQAPVLTKVLLANMQGFGATQQFSLPEGKYTLLWKFIGEHGKGRHKDFRVICHKLPHHPGKPGHPGRPPHGTPPHPTPSATPTKSAGPVPAAPKPTPTAPSSNNSGLPFTGFPAGLAAGIGALLVLGGAAATVLVRRRSQHSTGE